jgi:hypothetical protein
MSTHEMSVTEIAAGLSDKMTYDEVSKYLEDHTKDIEAAADRDPDFARIFGRFTSLRALSLHPTTRNRAARELVQDLFEQYKPKLKKDGGTRAYRKKFDTCVKAVRKTVKARKGSNKESAAIAICTKSVLQTRGRTMKKYRKGKLITQKF